MCTRVIAKTRADSLALGSIVPVNSLWLDSAELPHKTLVGNLSVYDNIDGNVTLKLEFCLTVFSLFLVFSLTAAGYVVHVSAAGK